MKKISIIIFIFVFSVFAFGQDSPSKPKWLTYVSPYDEFSLKVPNHLRPTFNIKKDINNNEFFISAKYNLEFNDTNFYIFSEVIEKENTEYDEIPINELNKFINQNSDKSKSIKINQFVGQKYTFQDSEGYCHQILIGRTSKRAYIFHTFSTEDGIKDSEAFIKSIKFRQIQDSPQTSDYAIKKTNLQKEKTIIAKTSSKNVESDSGTEKNQQVDGARSGNNNENYISLPNNLPNTTPTSALNILSKPRPSFNNLARIYQIQGTVILRVTFLANGQIGAVTPIKKLPFGLTNNAISVAKLIRFTPAQKDNVSMSVVKQVQYTFTLY